MIMYEIGDFWVSKERAGKYAVWRNGNTHSEREALEASLAMAIREAQRLAAVAAYPKLKAMGLMR